MIKWIKELIEKFKAWRTKKVLKKVPKTYKPVLLTYALQQSHLTKEEIRRLMEKDQNLPKKLIKKIIKLGSKKVVNFLNKSK